MSLYEEARKQYLEKFGPSKTSSYICSYAPGRMNFIGEHVDYLGGCVVPAALTMATSIILTAEPADKWTFSACSDRMENGNVIKFTFDDKSKVKMGKSFLNIMIGNAVEAWDLCKCEENPTIKNHPMHVRILVCGRVPLGAGVSSSASVCVATIQAFCQIFAPEHAEFYRSHPIDPTAAEKLDAFKKQLLQSCRNVEHRYLGVNCGAMDQYTSLFGNVNTVLKIDCGLLQHENVIFPDPKTAHYGVMLIDSMRPHELGDAYNKIRHDMEEAEKKMTKYIHNNSNKQQFANVFPKWNNQSLLKLKMLPFKSIEGMPAPEWMKKLHKEGILTDGEYDRASYAVEEMERTDKFVELTKDKHLIAHPKEMLKKMGEFINQTHQGLAKKLRVSTPELDKICEIMDHLPGSYGSRLMGGGFGGCAICLVDTEKFNDECREKLLTSFKEVFPELDKPIIFNSGIGFGALVEKHNTPIA